MRGINKCSMDKSEIEKVSKPIKKANSKYVILIEQPFLKDRAPSVKRISSRRLSRVIPKLDLINLSSGGERECLSARSPETSKEDTLRAVKAYKNLRDQLHKITQELGAEGPDINDFSKMQRQRRSREERMKRNFNLEDTIPIFNKGNNSLMRERLNNLQNPSHKKDTHIPIGIARKSVKMEKTKLFSQNNEASKQLAKENKRPSLKQLKILKSASNKKLINPNKHLVRKYLTELYTKIVLKVKDIEREKREVVMLKKGLEKCATSKSNLNKIQMLKRAFHQPKKSLQCDSIKIIS